MASLTGNYRPEHRFVLRQNLELYDALQLQIQACDTEIENLLLALAAIQDPVEVPPARSKRKPRQNEPRFEIQPALCRLAGADITQIDTIGPYNGLKLIAEIGTDMSRWPTERHFASWTTLAPRRKTSGNRVLSSRTQPSANRAAAILRLCAMVAGRTDTALGAYYRRLAYRIGKPKAITATARKIAILVYRVLRGDLDYRDPGAQVYEAQHRARTLHHLRKRARNLGFDLVDLNADDIPTESVS